MRALKILVVALGVLLVGGSVALVVAVVSRIQHGPNLAVNADAAAPVRSILPAGSRILAAELSGDRVLVRLAMPDGGERLLLLNARNGAEIAVFEQRADGADPRR